MFRFIRSEKIGRLDMPNPFNFDFEYVIVYFVYICASIPNFINTFVYLHRKRNQQLCQAQHHNKVEWRVYTVSN